MKTSIKIIVLVFTLASTVSSVVMAQHSDETGSTMPALNPKSPLADITGSHIGIRVPDYEAAIKWWTEKMDFRIVHEWPYGDEKLAYLAPANDNSFWVEVLAEGQQTTKKKYTDLAESLKEGGYHHICVHVKSVDNSLAELKKRGVTIIGEPFYLEAITRKLAFISDPWGSMIELSEVVKK